MGDNSPNYVINCVAFIASILTIVQFIYIIVQVYVRRETEARLEMVLSTILRHADEIKSRAYTCREAGTEDKEALLSSVETMANSIRIEIEEFQNQN